MLFCLCLVTLETFTLKTYISNSYKLEFMVYQEYRVLVNLMVGFIR